MEWTSAEFAKDEPWLTGRFPELAAKIESLPLESKSTGLVLFHLPNGEYDVEAFLSGHCYPIASAKTDTHADLVECPVIIPPIAYVRLRLTEDADLEQTKAMDQEVVCVFRIHGLGKSCLWSTSLSRLDKGLTEICIPIPAALEGWLVLQMPGSFSSGHPGMGAPLLDVKVPSDYKHDAEIPIRTKAPGDWSKRLPEWVVRGRYLKSDS